jgi:hypothetical protein
MTHSRDPRSARAHDLLADRALFGLDDADARELRDLGADADDSYDLAAAAIDLATLPIEPMPDAVADRIAAARHPRTLAGWVMPGTPSAADVEPVPPIAPPPPLTPPPAFPPAHPVSPGAPMVPLTRPRRRPALTWLAAAATLVLVAGAWWLLRNHPALTAAQSRADLLATATDATRLPWHPTPEAASASGDVVWSPSTQRGFLRFVGLPPNDPTRTQYQLWIFDRQRDQAYPVDGGVFDVSSTGEVVVPVTAKLRVGDATLFAVTVERPGGVVVSRREHIVVTAGG